MQEIGASKFKEKCLALLEDLPQEGVVVTKRGRPVAVVTPYPQKSADLLGRSRGKIAIHGDILSTNTEWDSDG